MGIRGRASWDYLARKRDHFQEEKDQGFEEEEGGGTRWLK